MKKVSTPPKTARRRDKRYMPTLYCIMARYVTEQQSIYGTITSKGNTTSDLMNIFINFIENGAINNRAKQ